MTIVVTRSGKGSALSAGENDGNLDSVCGINEAQPNTTYTVVAADQNRTIECSNASAIAVALDAIATIAAAIDTSDFKVIIKNVGAGATTITPNVADAIDNGASAIVLTQYEYVTLQTDSTLSTWNIIGASGSVHSKSILIGDWNMDSTPTVTVAHGIADITKISSMSALIVSDAGTDITNINYDTGSGAAAGSISIAAADTTSVTLNRFASGLFDSTNYDATSYNRGRITIQYVD